MTHQIWRVVQLTGTHEKYNIENIIDNLKASKIGEDALFFATANKLNVKFSEEIPKKGQRAEHRGYNITIYSQKNPVASEAAKSLIHEITHIRYNIGGCQHAEAVCMAMEYMHTHNRDITKDEWDTIVNKVKDLYSELNWEVGGYGDYEIFEFVK